MPVDARGVWVGDLLDQLRAELGELGGLTFEIYTDPADWEVGLVYALRHRGAQVHVTSDESSNGRLYAD